MFKHILLPTDGSQLSQAAMAQALQFAKETGARVTGLHAIPLLHFSGFYPEIPPLPEEQYLAQQQLRARECLVPMEQAARSLGVPCETVTETHDHPWEAIIQVAQRRGCDLIAMASHGRRGVQGLLMGSETHKVLTHSKIAVLVFR